MSSLPPHEEEGGDSSFGFGFSFSPLAQAAVAAAGKVDAIKCQCNSSYLLRWRLM